ncbi:MAG TPA: hypothetical protein VN541_06655 [Tepidisphaeraceae bacterium]|nr:hypothetical protein [Tepidisphaeraceae bacterium]
MAKRTPKPDKEQFSDAELDAAERRLRKLARNPNFISGIYNYCDRWCERCPMTSRCTLFAQENAEREEAGTRDAENEQFWRAVAKSFAVTKRMILKDMKEQGIDPSEFDSPEVLAELAKRKRRRAKVKTLGTTKAAMRYIDIVNAWFEAHAGEFEETGRRIAGALQADIAGQNPVAEFNDIQDAVEIIRWYQYQISVKLTRALQGLKDLGAEEDEDGRAFQQHDAEGSAKVALIGIDRSLAAWARLREHFPGERDEILDTLVLLDRLRRDVETVLPNARKFKRPGFDELPNK